jgi:hypothetical protein
MNGNHLNGSHLTFFAGCCKMASIDLTVVFLRTPLYENDAHAANRKTLRSGGSNFVSDVSRVHVRSTNTISTRQ